MPYLSPEAKKRKDLAMIDREFPALAAVAGFKKKPRAPASPSAPSYLDSFGGAVQRDLTKVGKAIERAILPEPEVYPGKTPSPSPSPEIDSSPGDGLLSNEPFVGPRRPLAGPPRPAMLGPAPESYTSLQKGVREYRQRLGEDAQTEFTDADKARFAVPEGDYAGVNPSGRGTFNTVPGLTDAQIASVNQPQVDRPITGTPSAAMPETSQWRQEVNRRNARMNAEEMADRARGFTKEGGYTRPTPEAQLDFMSDAMEDRSIGERQKSRQNTLRDVAQIKAGANQDTVIAGPDFGDQIATARLKFDRDKRKDSLAAVARGEERDARAAENARIASIQEGVKGAIETYGLDADDAPILADWAGKFGKNVGQVASALRRARDAELTGDALQAAVRADLGIPNE